MNENRKNKIFGVPPPLFSRYGLKAGIERSDEEIRVDLVRALSSHTRLDPSEIIIEVRNGVITLSGVVNSEDERMIAEHEALRTTGVVDVHNELQTRQK